MILKLDSGNEDDKIPINESNYDIEYDEG